MASPALNRARSKPIVETIPPTERIWSTTRCRQKCRCRIFAREGRSCPEVISTKLRLGFADAYRDPARPYVDRSGRVVDHCPQGNTDLAAFLRPRARRRARADRRKG